MRDFIEAAKKEGWKVSGPEEVLPGRIFTATRGTESIEIEISNGGIPHKVTRRTPGGGRVVKTQNYFRMAEVLGWLKEESK